MVASRACCVKFATIWRISRFASGIWQRQLALWKLCALTCHSPVVTTKLNDKIAITCSKSKRPVAVVARASRDAFPEFPRGDVTRRNSYYSYYSSWKVKIFARFAICVWTLATNIIFLRKKLNNARTCQIGSAKTGITLSVSRFHLYNRLFRLFGRVDPLTCYSVYCGVHSTIRYYNENNF